MKKTIIILFFIIFSQNIISAKLARLSSTIVTNNGDVEVIGIVDERDKNIDKEYTLYKYKKYSILFEITRLKEKDLIDILMESPDYRAIKFINLKLYEDKVEKGSIDIFFTSNSYFLIKDEKIIRDKELLNFLINYFPDNDYEMLFCIFSIKEKIFNIFLKNYSINTCEKYKINQEKREKLNDYSAIEEKIGYGKGVWENAEIKRNFAQIIK